MDVLNESIDSNTDLEKSSSVPVSAKTYLVNFPINRSLSALEFTPASGMSHVKDYSPEAVAKPQQSNENQEQNQCSKCQKKKCSICTFVEPSSTFKSTITGKTYQINHRYTCLSFNVIYLVTCSYCSMQYVGHSTLKLSERFRDFFSKIKGGNNWTMDKHFENETNLCQKEDIKIQIIDHVCISEIDRLEAKEVMWATELQTFKPKGNVIDNASLKLNEKILNTSI